MIFVTVGTHTQSFNRLLREMDSIAKKTRKKVIAQIGHSTYEPKNMDWFRFRDSIDDLYKKADIVICHGGAGSIMNALVNKKPVIGVPRYKKFDEHVNDHQIDLVKNMEREGKIIAVYDIRKLETAISRVKKIKKLKTKSVVCEEIEIFLNKLE